MRGPYYRAQDRAEAAGEAAREAEARWLEGLGTRSCVRIRSGERNATPEVMGAVARALEALAERHADAARILRDAISSQEE